MTINQKIIYSALIVAVLAAVSSIICLQKTQHVRDLYPTQILTWNKEVKQLTEIKSYFHKVETIILKGSNPLFQKSSPLDNLSTQKDFASLKTKIESFSHLGNRQEEVSSHLLSQLNTLESTGESLLFSKEGLDNTVYLQKLDLLETVYNQVSTIITKTKQEGFEECQAVRIYVSKGVTEILKILVGSFVLILILSITFALLISNQLSKSTDELKLIAHKLATGTFDIKTNPKNKGVFKKLNSSFNLIAEDLQKSKTIKELNEALKLKNDSLDSFVYRVSHDLKAPIVNIISLLNLIKVKLGAFENKEISQSFFFLEKSTKKLQNTISDLLEVSRIEQSLTNAKEWVDLKSLLENILLENSESIAATEVQISSDFQISQIYFPPTDLLSIFSNLINNSIKYSAPDRIPEIQIKTFQKDNYTCLQVKDNGIGIDLKKHETKLFGMFNRFHNHVEGSGVGLYIIKKIIEESGGKIEVESIVNKGTTFTLFFEQEKEMVPELH